MLLADIYDTPYNIVLFIHIFAMLVAFSPIFAGPFGGSKHSMKIHGSALIVGGLLGFGVSGMSKVGDELVYEVKDGWLAAAVVVWIAMNGVLHGLILPGEKAVAAGEAAGAKKVLLGGQVMAGLLVVALYLMVFKPGA
jgi:hypothetical protein